MVKVRALSLNQCVSFRATLIYPCSSINVHGQRKRAFALTTLVSKGSIENIVGITRSALNYQPGLLYIRLFNALVILVVGSAVSSRRKNLKAFKLRVRLSDISVMGALVKQTCSSGLRPPPFIIELPKYVFTTHFTLPWR